MLNGELFYTKILEVNLFIFVYKLLHWREIFVKQPVGKCKQINFKNLCVIYIYIFLEPQPPRPVDF